MLRFKDAFGDRDPTKAEIDEVTKAEAAIYVRLHFSETPGDD